jgi:hypothetical protein
MTFLTKDPIGFMGGDVNLYRYVDSVGKPLNETNLFLYTGNNPVNRIDPLGLDWIDDVANFSAGFGDTLTSGFGLTYLWGVPAGTESIRSLLGSNESVNKCSGFYTAGKVGGYAWGLGFGTTATARGLGWTSKIAIHGPHHTFGNLGELSHIQTIVWKIGAKGSDIIVRIPLPWR